MRTLVTVCIISDKKAACAAISGLVKSRRRGLLLECEIECCTGNNCNDEGNKIINITNVDTKCNFDDFNPSSL